MIISVVVNLFSLFFVVIIADEQAARRAVFNVNANFAHLAVGNGLALVGQQFHVIERNGLSHRAEPDLCADQISKHAGGFRLTEAFHDFKTGTRLELPENLGVESLARGSHMFD